MRTSPSSWTGPPPSSQRSFTKRVAAYEAGVSIGALAEQHGVSNSPIRRVLLAAGVQLRPPGRMPAGGRRPDLEELAAGYAAGESVSSLARLHDCNAKTMRRWLRDAGVAIDPYRRRSVSS